MSDTLSLEPEVHLWEKEKNFGFDWFFLYSSNSQTEMARSLFQLKFELSGLIWVKVKKGYFELKESSS